ncbi:MAG TPA: hypothetical protein VFT86_08635 [Gaiellaceae bacterium]|nr:hypothetical protein [Gaiellaceae bacterium]
MTRRTVPAIAAVLLLAGCGGAGSNSSPSSGLPQGSEKIELDPADFTTEIDNPYWPMSPGSRWVYREVENGDAQRVTVTVTDRTKTIDGIEARVVHDLVTTPDGERVEDTFDWYAQDSKGNLWYLGEDTKEYEDGKVVSTEGSWEHGVDGAQAGIVVAAEPRQGLAYREEYYSGEAEDAAEVLSVDGKVQVPFGFFREAMITRNYSGIEPTVEELKFYAEDVGPVLELLVSGGAGRTELLSYTEP